MLWISHRGNTEGSMPTDENTIDYILDVINYTSLDIEVDVWSVDNTFYLGHDEPGELLPLEWFNSQRFWFHAKNIAALHHLQQMRNVKYFWHQDDDYALTSNHKIWTYPGKRLVAGAIAVLPEIAYVGDLWSCHAICTDNILHYKRLYESRNIT